VGVLPVHIRVDVRRCALKEEGQAAQARLHLLAHEANPVGRDQEVIGPQHRAVAGVIDQGGDAGAVPFRQHADHLHRPVPGAVGVAANLYAAVGFALPAVDADGGLAAGVFQAHRLQAALRLPDGGDDVLLQRGDVLPVAAGGLLVGVDNRAGVGMGTAEQDLRRGQAGADAVHDELVDGQQVQRHQGQMLRPVVQDEGGGGQVVVDADVAFGAVAVADEEDAPGRGDPASGDASPQVVFVHFASIHNDPP